jgi:hypothetical protein
VVLFAFVKACGLPTEQPTPCQEPDQPILRFFFTGVTFGKINEVKTAYASSSIRPDLSTLAYITTFLKRMYEIVGWKMGRQI